MKFWHNGSDYQANPKRPKGDDWAEISFQAYAAAVHPNLYVYDVESYPNVFTCTFHRPSDGATWRFEISNRRNDGVEMFRFLVLVRSSGGRMPGFNNVNYDYNLIHRIVETGGHISAGELYGITTGIIESTARFPPTVRESERFIPQIDLFKIHHFDNKARMTSLKMLEFNMRSRSIQDLPFPPGSHLTDQQIDTLIQYNDKDGFETVDFLAETIPMLEFRDELTAKYGRDFTNHSDTKIGKDFFIMRLEESGIKCFDWSSGKREPRQTLRPSIDLNTVIFPWINFSQPGFQAVLDWLLGWTITKTKGVFEYLDVPPSMAQYMDWDLIKVHGLNEHNAPNTTARQREKGVKLSRCDPSILLDPTVRFVSGWKDQSGLNCIVNGFQYDFGTGGIHGSVESQIVTSDETHQIIDLDVASYYPNLAIANGLFPAHLGSEFCSIYLDVYNQRKGYAKGTAENAMLKLALNGVYGDSNNPYSPFFDPAYTMAITLNGQLLLCLLSEYLAAIPGLSMVQVNTDGLTVRCPRDQIDTLTFVAETWQELTGLVLERVDYNRMMIRDVNSYIAEYEDGGLKRKGAYCYGDDLEWHKDHGAQIVAIAAEAALVRGESIADVINRHTDPFDFMLRTKVPRNSRLMLDDVQQQNITRYYIGTGPGSGALVKVMPPTPKQLAADPAAPDRRIGIETGWSVVPCNDLDATPFDWLRLNRAWYIAEAEKLVKPLKV